jgi:hypothetical protein
MQKDLASHWIELSEEVRSLYGQKYLEDFQVHIKLVNDW